MPAAPGDTLADYVLGTRLGGGGSSIVFYAEHPHIGPAAIKMLQPGGPDEAHASHRFEREITFASAVDDPRIVSPIDHGRSPLMRDGQQIGPGRLWLASRYVPGDSAINLVPHASEPNLPAILRVLIDLAAALDHCHREGVLHRDVKPSNVLVCGTGAAATALLTDFGTAQYLEPPDTVLLDGELDISLPYAAPELLLARDLSPQTDGYAFAATAFELLTGRTPFHRSTAAAMSYAQLHEPVPAPERFRRWLPTGLTSVFTKALAKTPAQRYRTCGELADILRRFLRDVQPQDLKRR